MGWWSLTKVLRNDKHEFSWTWTVPTSGNNSVFHFALKCYFILKNPSGVSGLPVFGSKSPAASFGLFN
jgi:hypothetical protein